MRAEFIALRRPNAARIMRCARKTVTLSNFLQATAPCGNNQRLGDFFGISRARHFPKAGSKTSSQSHLCGLCTGWSDVAGLAWAHFHIGEVERDHQALADGSHQFELARHSVEEISGNASRSNDWLDRMAAICNASGEFVRGGWRGACSKPVPRLGGERIARQHHRLFQRIRDVSPEVKQVLRTLSVRIRSA